MVKFSCAPLKASLIEKEDVIFNLLDTIYAKASYWKIWTYSFEEFYFRYLTSSFIILMTMLALRPNYGLLVFLIKG